MIPPPPPADVTQLPVLTRLIAGIGHSTVLADFDFETYSEAGYQWEPPSEKFKLGRWRQPEGAAGTAKGLEVTGLDVYAHHPSTEVQRLAYNLKDGRGPQVWKPGMPAPMDLFAHLAQYRDEDSDRPYDAPGLIEAWNVGFELRIWNVVCVRKYGFPPIDPRQVRCAMGKARAWGLAGKLEVSGKVLAIPHPKLDEGEELVKLLTVPHNPTKDRPYTRVLPEHMPEKHARFEAYNDRDIVSEAEISAITPDLQPEEFKHWRNDQTINQRGMAVDLQCVDACIVIVRQALARFEAECRDLTGGIAPSELKQLQGWLAGRGVHTSSMDAEAIDTLLRTLPAGSVERRVVEIRSLAGSASVKKVFAIRNQVGPDGRLHDLYVYHGARTGRPTGYGPQPTNLPKAGPDVYRCGWVSGKVRSAVGGCGRYFGHSLMRCPWCGQIRGPQAPLEWNPGAMEDALLVISGSSYELVAQFFGDVLLTVAGCLRGLIVAGPGKVLVSSDFTAIEGVVIACLAGEQWRIQAYADSAPMYLLSAERMFGVSVAEMKAYAEANGHHHPLRQKGKGGELGLGFGGWVPALRNFGVDGSDVELKETVLKWREASPSLVEFWGGQTRDKFRRTARRELFGLEGAAIKAISNPGERCVVRTLHGVDTGISYLVHRDVLYCQLPSRRCISYHRPRLTKSTRPYADDWELQISFEGWNSNQKKGKAEWMRMEIYSGLLAENVTQAVARDIQMGAIDRCENREKPVVMHTYDEIVAEVMQGCEDVAALERDMCDVQQWAHGWPIKAAGGWTGHRYRKE